MKPYPCRTLTLHGYSLDIFKHVLNMYYVINLGHFSDTSSTHALCFSFISLFHDMFGIFIYFHMYIKIYNGKKCHQNIDLYKTIIGLDMLSEIHLTTIWKVKKSKAYLFCKAIKINKRLNF